MCSAPFDGTEESKGIIPSARWCKTVEATVSMALCKLSKFKNFKRERVVSRTKLEALLVVIFIPGTKQIIQACL